MLELITTASLVTAACMAAVALVLTYCPRTGWAWENNPHPGPLADHAYWRARGPDGRDLALTEEQLETAADRAKRIGWR